MNGEANERQAPWVAPQNAEQPIEPTDDALWFGMLCILVYATAGFFVAWLLGQGGHGQKSAVPLVISVLFAISTVVFVCSAAFKSWRARGQR
jgi:hypothetical protein